ncbi:hypothetical protein L596_017679 [Steinernema carpocapsae]|uniref:Uncharacterized protein n=1 Tax=Steinernema carpocapsae TaxID=34508 RepID=A0A4U5N2R2_STECR|nr:hypothetical protein L596_017679 [Steinernema carpocapsae]
MTRTGPVIVERRAKRMFVPGPARSSRREYLGLRGARMNADFSAVLAYFWARRDSRSVSNKGGEQVRPQESCTIRDPQT